MLLSQDRRRDQHADLAARGDGPESRPQRDLRFSESYIADEKAVHRKGAGQILHDLRRGLELVGRLCVGKGLDERLVKLVRVRQRVPALQLAASEDLDQGPGLLLGAFLVLLPGLAPPGAPEGIQLHLVALVFRQRRELVGLEDGDQKALVLGELEHQGVHGGPRRDDLLDASEDGQPVVLVYDKLPFRQPIPPLQRSAPFQGGRSSGDPGELSVRYEGALRGPVHEARGKGPLPDLDEGDLSEWSALPVQEPVVLAVYAHGAAAPVQVAAEAQERPEVPLEGGKLLHIELSLRPIHPARHPQARIARQVAEHLIPGGDGIDVRLRAELLPKPMEGDGLRLDTLRFIEDDPSVGRQQGRRHEGLRTREAVQKDRVEPGHGLLRRRLKGAYSFHDVVEELEAQGKGVAGIEDVHDEAAQDVLPRRPDEVRTLISAALEPGHQAVPGIFLPAGHGELSIGHETGGYQGPGGRDQNAALRRPAPNRLPPLEEKRPAADRLQGQGKLGEAEQGPLGKERLTVQGELRCLAHIGENGRNASFRTHPGPSRAAGAVMHASPALPKLLQPIQIAHHGALSSLHVQTSP